VVRPSAGLKGLQSLASGMPSPSLSCALPKEKMKIAMITKNIFFITISFGY
jgi:hypothetical protein